MKPLFLLVLAGIILGIWAPACKDKTDTSCDANFFEADVNGSLWEATEVTTFGPIGIGGHINITAKVNFGTLQQIDIQMQYDASVGQYNVDSNVGPFYIIVFPGSLPSDTGTLNITVHDTVARIIKGSLEFTAASGDLIVKNGSFCVKY